MRRATSSSKIEVFALFVLAACSTFVFAHHAGRSEVFNQELKELLALVSSQPRMGRRANRYKGARVVVIRETEHLMFYRVNRDHLWILALLLGRALRTPVGRD